MIKQKRIPKNIWGAPYYSNLKDKRDRWYGSKLLESLFYRWASEQPEKKVKRFIEKTNILQFHYFISETTDDKSSFEQNGTICLDQSRLIEGMTSRPDTIYCIGCVQYVLNKSSQRKKCANNVLSLNQIPKDIRLIMLGFISSQHIAIRLGTIINPDNMPNDFLVNGVKLKTPTYILSCRYLTLDASNIGFEYEKSTSQRNGNILEIEDNVEMNDITPMPKLIEHGEDSVDLSDLIERRSKKPSKFVYIFHWDPPFEGDRKFLSENSIEAILFARLEILCKLVDISHTQNIEQLQKSKLPITKEDHYTRDRLAIHYLCTICCKNESLSKWYIAAERIALSHNLCQLGDHMDRLAILQFNEIHLDLEKINPLYGFENYICDVIGANLAVCMKKASETSFDNKMEDVNDITQDLFSNLTIRCINYIVSNAKILNVELLNNTKNIEF